MTQENVCKSCEYYESCGKPERYMKCIGYKERQQAAGEQKVDVQVLLLFRTAVLPALTAGKDW